MARGREEALGRVQPPPSPQNPASFGAACDASFLDGEGIPSIVFGAGDLRLAHCKDESVSLAELTVAAKALAGCVLEWCGVEA
jgi:acetylornithine deacetylase/succinyl-diaminopimelate desuccinylase-like protein